MKKQPTFICEICHCRTPKSAEGSEPNTCNMCMPVEPASDSDKLSTTWEERN